MKNFLIFLNVCVILCILNYEIKPLGYIRVNGGMQIKKHGLSINEILFHKLFPDEKKIELEMMVNSLKYDAPLNIIEGFVEYSKLQQVFRLNSPILPLSHFTFSFQKDDDIEENVMYKIVDFEKNINDITFRLDKRYVLKYLITNFLENVLRIQLTKLPIKIFSSKIILDKIEKISNKAKTPLLIYFENPRTCLEYLKEKYNEFSQNEVDLLYDMLIYENSDQHISGGIEFFTETDIEIVYKKVLDLITISGVVISILNNEPISVENFNVSDKYEVNLYKVVSISLKNSDVPIEEISIENLDVTFYNSENEEIILSEIDLIINKGSICLSYCDILDKDICSLKIYYHEDSTEKISLDIYRDDAANE